MKRLIFLFFLLFNLTSFGQVFEYAEYYIDHDPGYGNASQFTVPATDNVDIQLDIPTVTLPDGLHLLVIRMRSSAGIWCVQGRMFTIINSTGLSGTGALPPGKVSYAEYFIDQKPEQATLGTGTQIPFTPANEIDLMTDIPLQNIPAGLHQLYVALRDSVGRWSISTRMFSIQENTGTSTGTLPPGKISYAEYFIDRQPNLGMLGTGTPIPFTPANEINLMVDIPIQNLNPGLHQLYVALKDSIGRYAFSTRMFSIQPGKPKITSVRFSFDQFENLSSGIIKSVPPTQEIDSTFKIRMGTLSPGVHKLYVMAQNSDGILSKPDSTTITVLDCYLPDDPFRPIGTVLVSSCENTTNYLVDPIPDATSYMWTLDNPDAGTVTGTSNNATINWNSSFFGEVHLSVRGINSCGTGNYSDPLLINRSASLPCAPTAFSATSVAANQITLTWADNSASETGFLIERSTDGISFTQVATTSANQTSYIDGISTKAGTIYYYRLYAQNGANLSGGTGCQYETITQGNFNQNYIKTYTAYKDFKLTAANQLTIDNSNIGYQYFDGLGRPIQNVQMKASPEGRDIVQPIAYDNFGRVDKEYLPYAISQGNDYSGAYRPQAIEEQLNFYTGFYNENEFTYVKTGFDNSPLNRVVSKTAPGSAWQSKPANMEYATNSGNEILWKVDDSGNLLNGGTYQAGELYKTAITDEDGHSTIEYKDKQGQVVLKESAGTSTAYVYDDLNKLRYVIPPRASEQAASLGGNYTNNTLIATLCYYYEYNEHALMKLKKIPGADAVYMVYDNRDLLVLSQDGEMRKTNDWMFTKYDVFSHPAITGKYHDDTYTEQGTMQTHVKTLTTLWETYDNSTHTYSNNAFPNTGTNCEIYSETYYDSKNFTETLGTNYLYSPVYEGVEESTNTKGQIMATKTRVLLHSGFSVDKSWLYTVNVYDKQGRVIQTIADNHKGGIDRISNKYNFAGELLESRQSHSNRDVVIDKQFEYDRMGRLLTEKQKLNKTGNWVTLSGNEYDELGKLKTNKIGGNLQTLDYRYNIRGWMTHINDPANLGTDLFAMQLKYTDGSTPAFNGNISQIDWKSKTFGELKSYRFTYDDLNRLLTADFSGISNANYYTGYSYDSNGNILSLLRNGKKADNSFAIIDNLSYEYNGNQLSKVNDSGSQNDGFSDNGSTNDNEISYDSNGNMLTNLNKKMANPIQYNFLNLPRHIEIGTGENNTIDYIYDAAGIKLQKITATATTDYIGNFIYEDDVLKYILTSNGRIVVDESTYSYQYNIKDQLGNNRVTFNAGGIVLQEDSYYPFGMTMNGLSFLDNSLVENDTKNKYLYNGKEFQEELGLDWLDYGARFYDATLGRFVATDPMSEDFFGWSPYNYVFNNPLIFIDATGMTPVYNWSDSSYYDNGEKVSWDYVHAYINSTIKNAAVYLFEETSTSETINSTDRHQGNWSIYFACNYTDAFEKLSKDIVSSQLDNLYLGSHGEKGYLETMSYGLSSVVLREVLYGFKPIDENGDILTRMANPHDKQQINALGKLMNLVNTNGNILFMACNVAEDIGFCYNLCKLAAIHGNPNVNLFFADVYVYPRYGEKSKSGAWLQMRLIRTLTNVNVPEMWAKITGGMNPKLEWVNSISITNNGFIFK